MEDNKINNVNSNIISDETTPLIIVNSNDNIRRVIDFEEILEELKEKRYPNYERIDYILYPLYVAVKSNDLELTQQLIDNYLDKLKDDSHMKGIRCKGDTTLLHIAIENNNIDILKMLVKLDIDRGFRDENGDTALSKAIYNLNEKAIKILKNDNTDPDNEINPYRNIIQYITKITNLHSRGTIMTPKNVKGISFTYCFFNTSSSIVSSEKKQTELKITELKNKIQIKFSKSYMPSPRINFHQIYITLLISFEDAKKVDAELQSGILGAAEGFSAIVPQLQVKYISTYIAPFLDSVDAAKLRQTCKTIDESFKSRLDAYNITANANKSFVSKCKEKKSLNQNRSI